MPGEWGPLKYPGHPIRSTAGTLSEFCTCLVKFLGLFSKFRQLIHLLLLLLRLKTCEKPGEASVAVPKLTISEFYKYSYASAYRISQERRAHSFLPEIVIKVCLIYMRYMNIFFTCTHTDPHPRNTLSVHSWLTSLPHLTCAIA